MGGGVGHSTGKRGYQARPWTYKMYPNHIFFRCENRPQIRVFACIFLICLSCPFQNLLIWPKTHLFFNFARFCTPKRCMRVQCLVLKNNPNLREFLDEPDTPLDIRVAPGGILRHEQLTQVQTKSEYPPREYPPREYPPGLSRHTLLTKHIFPGR